MTLLLFGCAELQMPAPFVKYQPGQGAGGAGIHTVSSGETLYILSKRYNLPARDIAVANNLSPPFYLSGGQRLKLPPPQQYRVRAGDNLQNVSRLFDVGASEIARANKLTPPYRLTEGQILRLPSVTRLSEPAVFKPSPKRSAPILKPPFQAAHVLKLPPGYTPPARAPAINPTQNILKLPDRMLNPPPHPNPVPNLERVPATKARTDTDLEKSPAIHASLSSPVKKTEMPDTPKRAGSKFLMPVKGQLISGYGPKSNGLYNDGINIRAPRGAPVRASENGVVVYAGNELRGSGNLILIRHADRWVTAYAHLGTMNVKRGDIVKRGKIIGTVGSTGSVDSPQLHFEIRRGTDALNPKMYIEG